MVARTVLHRQAKYPYTQNKNKYDLQKENTGLGMTAHVSNPSSQEIKGGGSLQFPAWSILEFQASLGYIVRLCFKHTKQGNKDTLPQWGI